MEPARTLLLVDDHPDSANVVARYLGSNGFEVCTARDCQEARAAAKVKRFDLVVCDVGLSDGDGCDLFRELRQLYGVVGIAYTGYGMADDVARVQAAGFASHLLKPATGQRLLSEVRAVLAASAGGQRHGPTAHDGSPTNVIPL